MSSSSQALRQQIEETKARLSTNLRSLEGQAKAESAEALVEIVKSAAGSLRSSLDIQHHIARHPWLALGGSAVIACLVSSRLRKTGHEHARDHVHEAGLSPSGTPSDSIGAVPARIANAGPVSNSRSDDVLHKLGTLFLDTLTSVIPPLTARIVPPLVDRAMENWIQSQRADSTVAQVRPSPGGPETIFISQPQQSAGSATQETESQSAAHP
jgi:hypothetical protein